MFQSLMKKVNETIPADLAQQVMNQASAAQSALSQASVRLGGPQAQAPPPPPDADAAAADPPPPPAEAAPPDAAAAAHLTDAERIVALAVALEKARAATLQAIAENSSLKKTNQTLEAQLKDLRLKAKLKITQLQRELDQAKGTSTADDSAVTTATATPSSTAPASPARPVSSRNPADVEMIDSLQKKVESLNQELDSVKSTPAASVYQSFANISSTDQSESVSRPTDEQLQSLQSKIASLTSETESLQSQLNSVQNVLREKDSLIENLVAKNRDITSESGIAPATSTKEIEEVKVALTANLATLEGNLQKNDLLLASVRLEKTALETKCATLESRIKEREEKILQLQSDLHATNDKITLDRIKNDFLEARCKSLEEKVHETETLLQKESIKLKDSVAEFESVLETKTLLSDRFRELTATADTYKQDSEAALLNLKAEALKLEGRVHELEELVSVLKSASSSSAKSSDPSPATDFSAGADGNAFDQLQAALAEKHSLLSQLSQSKLQSEALEAQVLELTQQVTTLTQESAKSLSAHKLQLESMNLLKTETENNLSTSKTLLYTEKRRVGELEQEVAELKNRAEEVGNEHRRLVDALKEEVTDAESKVVEMSQNSRRERRASAASTSATAIDAVATAAGSTADSKLNHQETGETDKCSLPSSIKEEVLPADVAKAEARAENLHNLLYAEKVKVGDLEAEIRVLKSDWAAAEKGHEIAIEALELELKEARDKVIEVSRQHDVSEFAKKVTEKENQIIELKGRVDTLTEKLEEAMSNGKELKRLEEAETQITKLNDELVTLKEVLVKKDEDLVKLRMNFEVVSKEAKESQGEKTFLMDEQIMDLKIQIANRQKEVATLSEALQRSKAEFDRAAKDNDEKIRKLKGLLGQASKTLQDSKRAVAEKDEEIEQLRSQLDSSEKSCGELKAMDSEHKASIDRLLMEIQDNKEIEEMKFHDLSRQYNEMQSELTRVRAEFQTYKIKAHTALQQSSTTAFEAKVVELEELNARLMREKMEAKQEVSVLSERVQITISELNTALDQLVAFETQIKRYEASSKELALLRHEVEACNRRIELEKELHIEALQSKDAQAKAALESLKLEAQLNSNNLQAIVNQKELQVKSLQENIATANVELANARAEAAKAVIESDRAKAVAAQASAAAASGNFASVLAAAGGHTPTNGSFGVTSPGGVLGGGFFSAGSPVLQNATVLSPTSSRKPSVSLSHARESFADLLGKTAVGGVDSGFGTPGATSAKERELLINFEKVSELLAEAEEEIRMLLEQEKVLKEEIRKNERAEKRNELLVKQQNVEYLKNIVLSFLETDAKEQLLPVIAKVLELSPDEVRRVRNSIAGLEEEKVRAVMPNFGFF